MPVFEPTYAVYIWACYALALVLIGAMVLVTTLNARKAKREHAKITKMKADAQILEMKAAAP